MSTETPITLPANTWHPVITGPTTGKTLHNADLGDIVHYQCATSAPAASVAASGFPFLKPGEFINVDDVASGEVIYVLSRRATKVAVSD